MKNAVPTLLFAFLPCYAMAQESPPHQPPAPGDRAPELQLAAVIGGADDAGVRLADLRGKVVVLEFWTTWCGGCLASAPHWNELVEQLEGTDSADFAFVSISNEKRDTVERCLERVPRKGLVVLDDDDKTFAAYDPGGVPHVVVVDREGTIAAVTHAKDLNAADLRAIARGEAHALPHKAPRPQPAKKAAAPPPTERRTVVAPAEEAGNRLMIAEGRFVSEGLPLHIVLNRVFGLPKAQMAIELPSADEPFDITIEAPGVPRDQIEEYARSELLRELQIHPEQRLEEQDVFVLKPVAGAHPLSPSKATAPVHTVRGMQLHCEKQPLAQLLSHLSHLSGGKLFLDETGWDGLYDYDLEIFDKASLVDALRAMGLEYAKDRREVSVTVLRPQRDHDEDDGPRESR